MADIKPGTYWRVGTAFPQRLEVIEYAGHGLMRARINGEPCMVFHSQLANTFADAQHQTAAAIEAHMRDLMDQIDTAHARLLEVRATEEPSP